MLCLWEYFPLTVCICAGIDSEACFLSCALRSLTRSLFWQQKKRPYCGTHCWRSLWGVSVKNTRPETHKRTDTYAKTHSDSCHPEPCAALMMRGRRRSMGGTIRVRNRRAKGDDSFVLTDNFLGLFFSFSGCLFLQLNSYLLFMSSCVCIIKCEDMYLHVMHLRMRSCIGMRACALCLSNYFQISSKENVCCLPSAKDEGGRH